MRKLEYQIIVSQRIKICHINLADQDHFETFSQKGQATNYKNLRLSYVSIYTKSDFKQKR